MLGQTIVAKAATAKAISVWLLVAIGLAIAGVVTSNPHLCMLTILPVTLAFFTWRSQPATVALRVDEDGLVLFGTQLRHRYEEFQEILLGDSLLHNATSALLPGPITLVHDHGQIFLPARMNVSSLELAHFLLDRIPPRTNRELHPSLREFAAEQTTKFGPDKVTHIHQFALATRAIRGSIATIWGKSLILSGIVWFVLGGFLSEGQRMAIELATWLGIGFASLLLGILLLMFGKSRNQAHKIDTKKFGPPCIVVTPTGMGVAQGDMQGLLRWDEVLGIKNGPGKIFGASGAKELNIKFAGGEIPILDVYDHSLKDIASLIRVNTRLPS